MPASLDLLPQTLRVRIPWTLPSPADRIDVVVDPDGEIDDITESSSKAVKVVASHSSSGD